MIGKVVVSGISIILVVGVVIGVVAGVHRFGNGSENGGATDNLTPQMKAVNSICAPTDYKEACMRSLSPVAEKNGTTDPKEFIKAAVKSIIDEYNGSGLKLTDTLLPGANNSQVKMGIEDCKDLFDTSVQELQASFSMVGDSDLHTINDRAIELQTWLSAVISYSTSCVDGIADPKIQSSMQDGLVNATQLTSNALAIVSALQSVLSSFNLRVDVNPSSRRLLGHTEVDSDGFPTWVSDADRKLLAAQGARARPNAVVAKDGSGQFKTISAAIAAIPSNFQGRYVIYVKAGVYNEYVLIDKKKPSIYMYGDGSRKTVVTGNKSFKSGFTTSKTATFAVEANGFLCTNMGFHNSAGAEGHQAVALRVQSDMSAFFNCRMDAYQDTLYVQAKRQFYRNCVIAGTIDFIFGDSSTVIQNSKIIVRRPMDNQFNTVTAQGRTDRHENTGIIIHNCKIVPEQRLFPDRFRLKSYLGRPWKAFSMTVVMESVLADFIHPEGWRKWDGENFENSCFYAEYGNRGPGANVRGRVRWGGFHVLGRNEALKYAPGPFLAAGEWLKGTGVPVLLGLRA